MPYGILVGSLRPTIPSILIGYHDQSVKMLYGCTKLQEKETFPTGLPLFSSTVLGPDILLHARHNQLGLGVSNWLARIAGSWCSPLEHEQFHLASTSDKATL